MPEIVSQALAAYKEKSTHVSSIVEIDLHCFHLVSYSFQPQKWNEDISHHFILFLRTRICIGEQNIDYSSWDMLEEFIDCVIHVISSRCPYYVFDNHDAPEVEELYHYNFFSIP